MTTFLKKQRLLEPIANKGFPRAECMMGVLYEEKEDLDNAVIWYDRAYANSQKYAAQELAFGQYALGLCYLRGYGVDRDVKKAFEWFHKAAEQKYPRAQQKMGNCYKNGFGVEKDKKKAAEWYLRTVKGKGDDSSYRNACYSLANCYKNGFGVEKDKKKAEEWCIKGNKYLFGDDLLDWDY